MKTLFFVASLLFMTSVTHAELLILDCPKVFVTNPNSVTRIENKAGWESHPSEGARLFCRQYIDTRGDLICAYRIAAHGASDIHIMKRPQPENASCVKNTAKCGFKCTSNPVMDKVVPRLDQKKLKLIK